jgi:outer membrane receptor protein involved in Fe transport
VEDELVPFEVPSMPGRDFFENAGKSRRSGLELALALQPCEGLTTSLAYTFSRFSFGSWELGPFLGVNNLFDEKYLDNLRLNARFGRSFEPAPERNVYRGVALAYRFDGP